MHRSSQQHSSHDQDHPQQYLWSQVIGTLHFQSHRDLYRRFIVQAQVSRNVQCGMRDFRHRFHLFTLTVSTRMCTNVGQGVSHESLFVGAPESTSRGDSEVMFSQDPILDTQMNKLRQVLMCLRRHMKNTCGAELKVCDTSIMTPMLNDGESD